MVQKSKRSPEQRCLKFSTHKRTKSGCLESPSLLAAKLSTPLHKLSHLRGFSAPTAPNMADTASLIWSHKISSCSKSNISMTTEARYRSSFTWWSERTQHLTHTCQNNPFIKMAEGLKFELCNTNKSRVPASSWGWRWASCRRHAIHSRRRRRCLEKRELQRYTTRAFMFTWLGRYVVRTGVLCCYGMCGSHCLMLYFVTRWFTLFIGS